MIGGTTRVVAILGDPVEHSRSPAMHNAAFAALGLDYVYVALRVPPRDLRRAMDGVRALGFAGLNVTVPHKEAILPFLDRLSPEARAIGAVNTVVRRGARLEGHNTDAEGFRRALAKLGFQPRGKSVVLLGAGGSARAVGWALCDSGIAKLTILNRTLSRATALAKILSGRERIEIEVKPLRSPDRDMLADADLIVNSTSIGLDGSSVPPVDVAAIPRRCIVYDLVYGKTAPPLVRSARRHRRRASDGRSMLLEQAGLAFRLWTGRRAPLAVMGRALSSRSAI